MEKCLCIANYSVLVVKFLKNSCIFFTKRVIFSMFRSKNLGRNIIAPGGNLISTYPGG